MIDITALKLGLTRSQKAMAHKCTALEQQFALEWVGRGCDPQREVEALEAAYGSESIPDVKCDTLRRRARAMTKKAVVRDFIDAIRADSIHYAIMDKSEAELRLSYNARVSIADLVEWTEYQVGTDVNGNPVFQTAWRIKESHDMPGYYRAAIKSLSTTESGNLKIDLHDSTNAIKALAQLKGWNEPTRIDPGLNSIEATVGLGEDAKEFQKSLDEGVKRLMDALGIEPS